MLSGPGLNHVNEEIVLDGALLLKIPDTKLVAHLYALERQLQTAPGPVLIPHSFTAALLEPRFVRSPIPDVQQLVGCILCDLVRLSQMATTAMRINANNEKEDVEGEGVSGEARAIQTPSVSVGQPLPFSSSKCLDVLRCIVKPFEEAAQYGDVMRHCHRLIERMSSTRVMCFLLPHCHLEEHPEEQGSELLSLLFSVIHTSSISAAMVPSTSNLPGAATAATESTAPAETLTLAVSYSRVLSDVIHTTHCITTSQLTMLLTEVVKASPTLRKSKSIAGWQSVPASFGALTASRVLLECRDTVRGVLNELVMDQLVSSVGALATNTIHERPEQRSQALHGISQSLEYLVAMAEIHVDFVQQLLPNLNALANQGDADIRRVLLRGLSMTYLCDRSIALCCRSAFEAFAAHMDDGKPQIRVEMLEFFEKYIHTSKVQWSLAEGHGGDGANSDSQMALWSDILDRMLERLLDSHPSVRLQAVNSIGNTLYLIPDLWRPREEARHNAEENQKELEQTLGQRMADKHPRVREAALLQLCRLYHGWADQFPWVPNFILSLAAHSDEATSASVEIALEKLLPSLHDLSALGSSSASRRRTTTSAKDSPLFDFEKKAARATADDSISLEVEGWTQFCTHLSPPAFRTLLKQAERKVSLRAAIRALYQFRQQLVADGDVHSDAGKLLLSNMRRLMNFIQSVTGAAKNEWDTLFRCKDKKVETALLVCCNESTDNWATARTDFVNILKGRVDNDTFTFAQEKLIRLLAFPIQSQHLHTALDQLLSCPDEARIRLLHVFLTASPSYVQLVAPSLIEMLCNTLATKARHSSHGDGKCLDNAATLTSLLDLVTVIPAAMKRRDLSSKKGSSAANSSMMASATAPIFQALERVFMGDYFASSKMSIEEVGVTSKKATNALLVLSDMLDPTQKEALLSSLAKKVLQRILQKNHHITNGNHRSLLCHLQSLRVLVGKAVSQGLKSTASEGSSHAGWWSSKSMETVVRSVGTILLDVIEHTAKRGGDGPKVKRSRLEREAEAAVRLENAEQAGLMADCAAKTISSVALSGPIAGQGPHVNHAIDVLLAGYKKLMDIETEEEASSNRFIRLAILQQLVKLVRVPSCDVVKDLAVAVVLSSEQDTVIRHVLQQKFLRHILRYSCDMRYVAHLLLLAMNAFNKNDFQELRAVVEKVGAHLRKKQAMDGGVSLSSPKAMCCYMEYTLPFIVLFLAHHPVFDEQKETHHFFAFQRVWHLVLEELLSPGLQCISFVGELLGRLKQAKDALDPQRNRTRTIAELGLAVLQQVLSKHEVAADLLKKFPGTILLPNFFVVSPQHPNKNNNSNNTSVDISSQDSYLDQAVQIPVHVPFRLINTEPSTSPTPSPLAPASFVSKGAAEGAVPSLGAKRARSTPSPAEQHQSESSSDSKSSRQRLSASKAPKATRSIPVEIFREVVSNENGNINKMYEGIQQAVNEMTAGLSKPQIAQLRWKDIRLHVENCVINLHKNGELNMEDMLSFAKKRLREKYANAPL